MSEYKPLTDDILSQLAVLATDLGDYLPDVVEQARRANALAKTILEHDRQAHRIEKALARYLGETHD